MIPYYLPSLENDNCCVNEIITSVLYCLSRDYTETLYLLLIFSQEWRICYRKYLGRQTQRYSESRQEMIRTLCTLYEDVYCVMCTEWAWLCVWVCIAGVCFVLCQIGWLSLVTPVYLEWPRLLYTGYWQHIFIVSFEKINKQDW